MPPHDRNGKRHQHGGADQRTHATGIVHPFAHADAANVQQRREPQQAYGEQEEEDAILGEAGNTLGTGISQNAAQIEQERGQVEHIGGPISPAAHEAMEIAEGLFGPHVEPALGRIAVRELDDCDALR